MPRAHTSRAAHGPLESPSEAPNATKGAPQAARLLLALFLGSTLLRFGLAAYLTKFILVDDAYIHLRYARNLVQLGEFVYNPGEAVFGLTSPLYGLVTAGLFAIFGAGVELAIIALNVLLWSLAGWLIARELSTGARLPLLSLFLLAPVFVDNQLLGMETPLLVLLLAGSVGAARRGQALQACLWFGPALITRPEAFLLAPFLLSLAIAQGGLVGGLKQLLRPLNLAFLLGPLLLWVAYASSTYGSLLPQSMLAKTGWGSTHYDSLFTLQNALLSIPRLSFLPFIDRFPSALQWTATALILCLLLLVLVSNVRRGNSYSRTWLGFYLTYIGFFLVGKGATEASWYAVPSSLALLCAAEPCLPRWLVDTRRWGVQLALMLVLAALSSFAALQRAPLLRFYVDSYGACAEFLERRTGPEWTSSSSVAIGEIGVFGYRSSLRVTDMAALVSPEILPLRNRGDSFVRIVQLTGVRFFVVSEKALQENTYPALSALWSDAAERSWLESNCEPIAQFKDKHVYEVLTP